MIGRFFLVAVFLTLCMVGIAGLFWHQEVKYALPTPVPVNYSGAGVGAKIELTGKLPVTTNLPVFLHFFNPECPCSRFNNRHFLDLVNRFKDQYTIYAVIPAYADAEYAKNILGNRVPILQDHDNSLSNICGVYATPQAVIVDTEQRLYYRGNYNKSRYCTRPETNFAEHALTAFVQGDPPPLFNPFASQAYGCELPTEEKKSFFEF